MAEQRLQVLLVDDDEEDYIITADIIYAIPGGDFQVHWESSFDAALAALDAKYFDLLCFDYRLGPDTGIDLLKEVKARNYPAPVILLTGQQDREIDDEAIRLGAADYLIKGKITPDSFERTVRHALEQNRALTELKESHDFLQSIIDALTSEIAILGPNGILLNVNAAWQRATVMGGTHLSKIGVGSSYTEILHDLPEECVKEATQLLEGVGQVLGGTRYDFYMEYPCLLGERQRWSTARVSAFDSGGDRHVIIAFEDITERKLAELELEKNRALLEELSVRDELTGLYNRRYFNIVLKSEFERAQRYKTEFALLLLDIDKFKSVNDTYGHQAGDEAIRHVARLCVHNSRTTDCVARFGGEEIAFILPETNAEQAFALAERTRANIERTPVSIYTDTPNPKSIHITASFGLGMFAADADTVAGMIEFADRGLYQAKQGGRNQTRRYQPS